MSVNTRILVLSLVSGALLTTMIMTNSYLARYNSPLFASWLAHGSGAIVAWMSLMVAMSRWRGKLQQEIVSSGAWWRHLGGIPGALTVLLAAITVNGPLALSGTLALMLTGQIIFGLLSDSRGWFGVIKHAFVSRDFIAILLVLTGSAILIFARP
ncbi:TPA: DMT family transporter [Yersinia enterocolitica]|uniref:DMT family transporter n=1 Tax=Yersinia enterocolitica TaxID=630 RepID=UPI00094B8AA3|nr:DMT family transporter [Yersinia enterocolitica]MBW5833067.1 DMT family transporter [Yersinia enterocolitica]HDL8055961.1 DMT family transporter [Yersinia enterocolitica]HDM8439249.1 DMT family transporter [Yersinia enterocolitica]HEI6853019.1 DMT family transporter [Yersinia enterocolitica]HEN3567165.1 DMT family transporter [Yersinia enterocolitica]